MYSFFLCEFPHFRTCREVGERRRKRLKIKGFGPSRVKRQKKTNTRRSVYWRDFLIVKSLTLCREVGENNP